VHLSPKALELLNALVESRPRALSKAALIEQLWPATFVSEANLATLIAEIRVSLRDQARNSRFVRTVPRFGYAFAGTAVPVSSADRAQSPPIPRLLAGLERPADSLSRTVRVSYA
jgi:DNA-binding winged helix-turn-helix (wHTH) protein